MAIDILGRNGIFRLVHAEANDYRDGKIYLDLYSKTTFRTKEVTGLAKTTSWINGPKTEVIGLLQRLLKDLIVGEGDYWASDPEFPVEDWQREVDNNDTRQGYHDWLLVMRQWAEEDKASEPDEDNCHEDTDNVFIVGGGA